MFSPEEPRASAPQLTVKQAEQSIKKAQGNKAEPSLGPLTELTGSWVGPGFNMIALPTPEPETKFRVKLNATHETFTFTDDVGLVPNRGNTQPDILYRGLRYLQQVDDANGEGGLHIEPGLFINLPANKVQTVPTVVRMGTVPHGDSLLGQGKFFGFAGAPKFGVADGTPFTLNPDTGARINDTSEAYLAPYHDQELPPGIPREAVLNPNVLLQQANDRLEAAGSKIIHTTVMEFNATPVGGINGTPVTKDPGKEGGIVNIPFIVKNANANSMSSIFWINTVETKNGRQFLQLQYTQTVILDFPVPGADGKTMVDIKWPHISVATLTKR